MIDFLLALALVYGLVCGALFVMQRGMMYFPGGAAPSFDTLGIDAPDLAEVQTKDGLSITGWYWPARDTDKPTVVYFHGNAQEYTGRVQKALMFREAGYGFFFAGYRGYGGNEGAPSEQGLYADARAYLNWLVGRGVRPAQMVLLGESLGTGVAVQMATEVDIAAVILESPYSATTDVAKLSYFMFPVELLMKDQYRSIDKIQDINAPLFIIHGAQDTLIPIGLAQNLYKKAQEPKSFVSLDAAGHNDMMRHGVVEHMLDFLRNLENSVQIQ